CRPDRRQPHIAGEYRVLGSKLAQHTGDLLWMDQSPSIASLREIVKALARLLVMMTRIVQVRAISLLVDTRQYRLDCRSDIAHEPELDRCTATQVLRSDIDLRNVNITLRIELSVREISAK